MQTIDIPIIDDVYSVLEQQKYMLPYDKGQALKELESVETAHRKWVNEIVDLSDFPHCYFVNGLEDAIHHWKLTETRPWQKLEGEYDYPDTIGESATVCCDVLGQYMNQELGRSAIPADVKNDRPLYLSIPSHADGNFFSPKPINAPVILDCSFVGSTNIQTINVPKNTEQVFFDFTRGFGKVVQGIGLVYTKQPHASLEKLKELENWNYIGVKIINSLISNFAVDEMWNRHKDQQFKICNDHNIKPADCFYMATSRHEDYKNHRLMRWNDTAKICITSLFDKYNKRR